MASEQRLIDANAFEEQLNSLANYYRKDKNSYAALVVDEIITIDLDCAPTVEAAPIVHGRWIRKSIGQMANEVICSNCGQFIAVVFSDTGFEEAKKGMNYCNECGAKMDGDKHE